MYKAIRSNGVQSVNFFIMLVLVGNFIMFNLFLAILLGNFEQASMIIKSEVQQKILDKHVARGDNRQFMGTGTNTLKAAAQASLEGSKLFS